jgi:RNA polymerase sigma-70 factor (ECF subfamily)
VHAEAILCAGPADRIRPARAVNDLTVRRAQQGDAAAFEELYRTHALSLRLEGDGARAEELTQDVFVRAWERLPTFRGESAFGTWLHRLAVNVVLADRRSLWRRGRRLVFTDDPASFERPGEGVTGNTADLEGAIAALPKGARAVFVLHDVEGYTHEEIAQTLGVQPGTSKAQLFRARAKLRTALAEFAPEGGRA